MNRPSVIIDIDGVLYPWLDMMRRAVTEYAGVDPLQVERDPDHWGGVEEAWHLPNGLFRKAWRRGIEDGWMYTDGELIGGAATIEALWWISDAEYSIELATARLNQFALHAEVITQTVEWLAGFGVPYRGLSFTPNKTMEGLVIIDDNPAHIVEAQAEHKILWSADYNLGATKYDLRAHDWADVLHYLEMVGHG